MRGTLGSTAPNRFTRIDEAFYNAGNSFTQAANETFHRITFTQESDVSAFIFAVDVAVNQIGHIVVFLIVIGKENLFVVISRNFIVDFDVIAV